MIGLASAREAALRGLRVTVFDQGVPGKGSTWAAAGMLSPASESRDSGPFLRFGLDSLSMYGEWADALAGDAKARVGLQKCEKLHLATSDAESRMLQNKQARARANGVRVEWLSEDELPKREPALSRSFRGGLLIRDDYQVDNRRLAEALVESCLREGVQIHPETAVGSIRIEGGTVVGVTLATGERVDGNAVLVAAGAWSATLQGLPRAIGVRPVRGQMLALSPREAISDRILESDGVYLVPRQGGRLLVGATVENVGFEDGITAGGVRGLLDAAVGMVPTLCSAPIQEIWSGLRPGTDDGEPIIGADPDVEGLFYATGHFRNGILLAPLTARVVSDLISGHGVPSIPVEFSPGRMPPL